MIIRTKPGAESKKGSAAEGLQELKSAFLKSREQTERLERVIRLCETARAASDRRALGYTALNDTLAAIDYRQAALWWRAADDAGAGRIEGLSGVADPVRNAAFPAWLVKRLGGFADAHPAGASSLSGSALADELVQPFNVLEHPPAADHDRMMAKEFLPAQALWANCRLKRRRRAAPASERRLSFGGTPRGRGPTRLSSPIWRVLMPMRGALCRLAAATGRAKAP